MKRKAGVKFNTKKKVIKSVGVKHEEWREPEVAVTTDDKASHEAEDRAKTHSGDWWRGGALAAAAVQRARQPRQNQPALAHVTYGFGCGRDVLDDHLALGAQVLLAQRCFAILVQVHVLLHMRVEREGDRQSIIEILEAVYTEDGFFLKMHISEKALGKKKHVYMKPY